MAFCFGLLGFPGNGQAEASKARRGENGAMQAYPVLPIALN